MASKKNKKNMLNNKNVVIYSIMAAILIFAGLSVAFKNKSTFNNTNNNVEQNEELEVKDGVYINPKYDISFKYNGMIFTEGIAKSEDDYVVFSKDDGVTLTNLYLYFPNTVNNRNGEELYSSCLQTSETDSFIKRIFVDENKCVLSRDYKRDISMDTEPNWGYVGYVSTDKGVFSLVLNSSDEKTKIGLEDDFLSIINSFSELD